MTTRPLSGAAAGHAASSAAAIAPPALPAPSDQRAAARRRRQEGRERRTRQRLRDGGVEERAQERARIVARRGCLQAGYFLSAPPASPALTIQGVPNLSVHMPKPSAQNVFWYGIVTLPPAESASKIALPLAASA